MANNSSIGADIDRTTLQQWNSEFAQAVLPVTIILCIYLVIGVLGNSFVIYVYVARLQGGSESRFFIPYLAVFDLAACIVGCLSSIVVQQNLVLFESDVGCKLIWYFGMTTTAIASLTLLIIAVEKYKKICKPFKKQMTRQAKKISVVISVVVCAILCLPSLAFYGTARVKNEQNGIEGTRCTSISGGMPTVAIVFKFTIFVITAIELVILIVLYSLIGKVIYRQMRFTSANNAQKLRASTIVHGSLYISKANSLDRENSDDAMEVKRKMQKRESELSITDVRLSTNIPGFQITLMFIVITAVFIVCMFSKLSMLILESLDQDFWLTRSKSEMGGYRFLYTLIIINNIVNPFIYGFMDRNFKEEVRKIFRRSKS